MCHTSGQASSAPTSRMQSACEMQMRDQGVTAASASSKMNLHPNREFHRTHATTFQMPQYNQNITKCIGSRSSSRPCSIKAAPDEHVTRVTTPLSRIVLEKAAPVVLFLCCHPGGQLGPVEGDVQAMEGCRETELQRACIQVQRGPEELLQRVLQAPSSSSSSRQQDKSIKCCCYPVQ
jgi:hypothetical protein